MQILGESLNADLVLWGVASSAEAGYAFSVAFKVFEFEDDLCEKGFVSAVSDETLMRESWLTIWLMYSMNHR